MHSSIIKVGARLKARALDETLFTCPLCPKLKTSARKMNGHMEGHINMAVHFKDKIICRCSMTCRHLPHYHCPYCARTVIKRKDAEIHVKACYSTTASPSALLLPSPLPQPPVTTQTMLLQDHNYALETEDCAPALETQSPPAAPGVETQLLPAVPDAETQEPPAAAETQTQLHSVATDPECSQSLVSLNVFPVMQDHDYLQNSTLMSDNSSVSPEALDLRSSRVKYLKVVKCPHCALVLYKKNLATHIQRKHKKTKDNSAIYHLKCVCVNQGHEENAVQKDHSQSFSVPVHVQHKTNTREAVEFGQNRLLALKGGLSSLCEHIRSLDSCVNTATENFLKAEVLEEMLAFEEILNSHLRKVH